MLSLKCEEIKEAGYAYGDVLTVKFLDQEMELPFCSNYSDVDSGSPAVFARAADEFVKLAINMGDFATTYGIAVKTTNEDKTFEWNYAEGVEGPVTVTIALKEAGGYYDEYVMHQLSYTNAREDYPDLTDAEFANFRAVATTGMGEGVFYRSSSPVNPEIGRNAYADAALKEAGVTVVMNLAEDTATVEAYEGYAETYYATTNYIALNMGVDFSAAEFQEKLAEGLRFFAENPGVYLIHCTEGKDRAGFVAALLECLMGATYDEVVADYMTTFYNFYGVTADDARYATIAGSNIVKTLSAAFGVSDLASADLAAAAETYLLGIGLTETELAALVENLSAVPAEEETEESEAPEETEEAEETETADDEWLTELLASARDTDFFTPIYHTDLNYDELEYEHVDPATFSEEVEALRTLCADAANVEEFKTRFLDLADDLEYRTAMYYLLSNMQYADGTDMAIAAEMETLSVELTTVYDAFNGLVRDALSSPCAAVFDDLLSEEAREEYLDYEDMTDEELELTERETALQNEYMALAVEEYTAELNGVEYTDATALEAYYNGEITYDEYIQVFRGTGKAANAVLGPILIEMIGIRNRMAELKGYDSYAAYSYENQYGRDYTPEEAQAFCDAVKTYIVPKFWAYYDYFVANPDQSLMPEDVVYTGVGMFETLFPYFAQLSDELLESAMYTYQHKAYDLDPSPYKNGTAYSWSLPYYNMPFYFNNAEGNWYDLTTSIHELGHNNEAYWISENWNEPGTVYDTAEVHSQALELLMLRYYPELFGDEADTVAAYTIYSILYGIVDGCMYDEFQRIVYEMPDLTLEKANQVYRRLCEEYGYVDASDERTEMYGWYQVPHNFTSPMYYISYATSAAGAFSFWDMSQDDFFAAVDDYLKFTSYGFSLGFDETFEAVGMLSPMTEAYISDLAQTIHDKLLPIAPYSDVYADEWFAEAVVFMDYYALMNGVGHGRFGPTDTATREQGMTILARLGDEREDAEDIYTLEEGVQWCIDNGISDGSKRKQTLTREQFITMLYRFAAYWELDTSVGEDTNVLSYLDAFSVSSWAMPSIQWAVGMGIVDGYEDETLRPQGDLNRAEMAAMLERFIIAYFY